MAWFSILFEGAKAIYVQVDERHLLTEYTSVFNSRLIMGTVMSLTDKGAFLILTRTLAVGFMFDHDGDDGLLTYRGATDEELKALIARMEIEAVMDRIP